MKGKKEFYKSEADQIRQLLREKSAASPEKQKSIRQRQRNLGFYLSKYPHDDFDMLEREGYITIIEDGLAAESASGSKKRDNSDESYVVDLCDEVLGANACRQHSFPFLRGDSSGTGIGRPLPVDAYYHGLCLVVEYCERQHTEEVPFFDRRMTVSGVGRGEQRAIYDQRRRDVLPEHGIQLVELHYDDFECTTDGRLARERDTDLQVVRSKLQEAGVKVA